MATVELLPGIDLLQSMRSVGYSFEAAVADIIDNSITAGASRVEILVDVAEGRFVSIRDNGLGMSADEATEALRLAGTARSGTDDTASLGRFGLGLKTASLSQGRRVDVISRRNGATTGLAWDIDLVMRQQKWVVEVLSDERLADLPDVHVPDKSDDGTVVLWTKLDYLIGNAPDVTEHLAQKVDVLREHLGLVFHHFIQDNPGLEVILNGSTVPPIDPFLEALTQTQRTPIQSIIIERSPVQLQGFTLPHPKDIPADLKRRHDLSSGLREGQGFYVYRNRRLISQGGWFGLRRKAELTKQARVRVDITDGLDFLWQIDIRKARSEPPSQFRNAIRPLMDRLVLQSEKVHKFRGRRVAPATYSNYWEKQETREGVRFLVNQSHPIVERIISNVDAESRELLRNLLHDLADFFPYYDTYLATAQNQLPETNRPSDDEVVRRMQSLKAGGFSMEEVASIAAEAEPFRDIPNLENLMKEVWADAPE